MRIGLNRLIVPAAAALVVLLGCHSRKSQTLLPSGRDATFAGLDSAMSGDPDLESPNPRLHPVSLQDAGNIAKVTAELLERKSFLRNPDHKMLSDRMFALYLKNLDPLHYYLLQSDIDEFEAGKAQMYDKVLDSGDTSLGNLMYARYQQRFDEAVAAVTEALKANDFKFDTNETIDIDRKNASAPKTIDDAKKLWIQRLKYEYLQELLTKAKPDDIVKTLTKRYARMARTVHENDSDDILERYLNALAHSYDPHSDYFGKAMTDRFNDEMQLSLVGIGASLQEDDDGYCKIMGLLPGGPAVKSGQLHQGDRIVAVAQGAGEAVDCVEMKTDKIVGMIRGKKGTEVRLTILPKGAAVGTRKVVSLVRDDVKLEEKEATAEVIDDPTPDGKTTRLGYINLPSFYADFSESSDTRKSTTTDVAKLVKKLQAEKIKGLIIDLRNNGGGSLDEVIRMTGLFVRRPSVVQVKRANDSISVLRAPDAPTIYDGPMIVLTNRYSASASEIFAGAMQNYNRAVIVGDTTTFGKGTVQTVEQLQPILDQNQIKTDTNPGELKYTIQKFYLPSGASTQIKGVNSDIVIPSTTNIVDEYSEQNLDYNLPYDTVQGVPFDKTTAVQPYLAELKRGSGARIAKDPDFVIVQKVVDEEKRVLAKKTLSLNEQTRMKEKQEQDARLAEVNKAIKARPPSKEKIYKLTLKLADAPGLPPAFDPSKPLKKPADEATDDTADPVASSLANLDTTLEETERIMLDFIGLAAKPTTASR